MSQRVSCHSLPPKAISPLKWTSGTCLLVSVIVIALLVTLHFQGRFPPISTGCLPLALLGGLSLITWIALQSCAKQKVSPPPPSLPAAPLSLKEAFAKKELESAAHNIFADPLLSLVELAKNGFDASDSAHPTGKFGLGFLSILSLLEWTETGGCAIDVETAYRSGEQLSAYAFSLQKEGGYHAARRPSQKQESGTDVVITPKSKRFSETTLRTILRHLYLLQYFEYGHISVQTPEGTLIIGNRQAPCRVWAELFPDHLLFRDRGCGISETIYNEVLFKPSVSSKKPSTEATAPSCSFALHPFQGKSIDKPHLLVLVNGVVVVQLPLDHGKDFLLSFPANTSLTLARSALIVDVQLERSCQQLIQQVVSATVAGHEDPLLLSHLYHSLVALQRAFPAFPPLAEYLKTTLYTAIEKHKIRVIPWHYGDSKLEKILHAYAPGAFFLPLPEPLCFPFISPLELWIHSLFPETRRNLIMGKAVLFVDNRLCPLITSGNLPGTLFVPKSFLEGVTDEELAFRIASLYSEDGKMVLACPQGDLAALSKRVILWPDAGAQELPVPHYLDLLENGLLKEYPASRFAGLIDKIGFLTPTSESFSCTGWKEFFEHLEKCNLIIEIEKHRLYACAPKTLPSSYPLVDIETFIRTQLPRLTPEEVVKIHFEELLKKRGISLESRLTFYSDNTPLWPLPADFTAEHLLILEKLQTRSLQFVTVSKPLSLHRVRELAVFLPYQEQFQTRILSELLAPLFWLAQTIEEDPTIPPENKHCFRLFEAEYLQMLHRYFTVKDSDYMPAYGAGRRAKTSFFYDGLLEDNLAKKSRAHDFFAALPPVYFQKMVALLREHFSKHLDIPMRNEKLLKNRPNCLESVPDSYLTSMVIKVFRKTPPPLMYILIDLADHPEELKIICLLLNSVIHKLKEQVTSEDPASFRAVIAHALSKLRAMPPQTKDFTFIQTYLERHFSHQESLQVHPFTPHPQALHAPSFSTHQLMNALSQGKLEGMSALRLSEFLEIVTASSDTAPSQSVSHCVNCGSERPPKEAALIEIWQNTLDAIKGFLTTHGPVRPVHTVQLTIGTTSSGRQLTSKVQDQVGFTSLKTLLIDFLVPYFSEKGAQVGLVGKMGNGFFQVYQEVAQTQLTTRLIDGSGVYTILTEPLRNREGKVIGFTHRVVNLSHDPEYTDFVGTQLDILWLDQKKEVGAVLLDGLELTHFVRTVFTTQMVTLPHHQKVALEVNREALPDQAGKFAIHHKGFSFVQKKEGESEGWAYTEGYPFRPLPLFLEEERLVPQWMAQETQGWNLNIPREAYLPTQSRTRLKLSPEGRRALKEAVAEWVFFQSAFLKDDLKDRCFPHFSSPASYAQVFPANQRQKGRNLVEGLGEADAPFLEDFYLHYRPCLGTKKSFFEQIDYCYKHVLSSLDKSTSQRIEEWKKSFSLETEEPLYAFFIQQIVFPWVDKKLDASMTEQIARALPQKKVDTRAIDLPPTVSRNLKSILKSFCDLYLIHHGKKPLRAFIFENSEIPRTAYYNRSSHQICLNLKYLNISSFVESLIKLLKSESVSHLPGAEIWKLEVAHCPTLYHELFHAFLGETCGNFHPQGLDAEGQFVTFDARATSYARQVIAAGHYLKWREEITPILPLSALEELLEKVKAYDPDALKQFLVS